MAAEGLSDLDVENAVADDLESHYFRIPYCHSLNIVYGDCDVIDRTGEYLYLDVNDDFDGIRVERTYSRHGCILIEQTTSGLFAKMEQIAI